MALESLVRNAQLQEIWSKYSGWTNKKVVAVAPQIVPGEKLWGIGNEDLITLEQKTTPINLTNLGITETGSLSLVGGLGTFSTQTYCSDFIQVGNCKTRQSKNRQPQAISNQKFYFEISRGTHRQKIIATDSKGKSNADVYIEVEIVDWVYLSGSSGDSLTLAFTNQ